ncbi:MAG TPA: M36 family metallopeptidase, partial [Polyangium sp.]|nr:M36 family metallopeptidase [Polyangium sp.]
MKRHFLSVPLALALLGVSSVHAASQKLDINKAMSAASTANATRQIRTSVGAVASVDEKRGVPTFLWVAPPNAARFSSRIMTNSPEQIARAFVEQNMALYRLSAAALEATYVRHVHDPGRGGIVVKLGQKIGGIEILNHSMKVLVDRQGDVLAVAGNLHSDVSSIVNARFVVPHEHAVAKAFEERTGIEIGTSSLRDTGREEKGYRYYDLVQTAETKRRGIVFANAARVKKVHYAWGERLVSAYYVELDMGHEGSSDADLWAYVVSAENGELLQRDSLTQAATYNYRLWAETTGMKTPHDGPLEDWTPHPAGVPNGQKPPYVDSSMVSMDGFNTNPGGTFDPWLPAAATATSGNNVNAYADINGSNGFQIGDPQPGPSSGNSFDYTYDTSLAPGANLTQQYASVTSLFYMNNWLHDYFYDSGFDEAAGNAQVDNFGRGGTGNDPILAEAQDYLAADNANMATPADGQSPRMQMFVFSGAYDTAVIALPLNQFWRPGTAQFGAPTFNVTATAVVAEDGAGPDVNDICQAVTNDISGKIAVVNRGSCSFEFKALLVEQAGGVGILIVNNQAGAAPAMADDPVVVANIPALSLSQADGAALKAAMQSQIQTVTMVRGSQKVDRDGTIDNHIVAHEWGHYLHHRYIPQTACSTFNCGTLSSPWFCGQCPSESEGWGDFIAMHMTLRAQDDISAGTFALAMYASDAYGDSAYYGIRRYPYSRDFNKNGLTFKHITQGEALPPGNSFARDNNEVHNAGEVWASMMFQAYTELLLNGGHTFDDAKRRMADYVVGGLALAPDDPTFTQQRDSILAVARAVDMHDAQLLADGFAARGAGTCAVSPPITSTTQSGVVEDFDNVGVMEILSPTFSENTGCDDDGVVDTDETGTVEAVVFNSGLGYLLNTQVTISSTTSAVMFPSGTTATIASIAPGATGIASFPVALVAGTTAITDADFAISATNAAACVTTLNALQTGQMNYDDVPDNSSTEQFESPRSPWVKWGNTGSQTLAAALWNRERQVANDYWFHGADYGTVSDTALESPSVMVGTGDLTLTFAHRHDFDGNASGATQYHDGGVVEISTDNGMIWTDIGSGYSGTIQAGAGNPLEGREVYGKQNASWPNTDTVTLNLGTAYAGQTIKIRFRTGSDNSVHQTDRLGWFIDDVAVTGITNTPFWTITTDAPGCSSCTGVTCNDDNPCTTDSCNAANGQCVFTNAVDGTTCDDDDACTQTDACQAGACAGTNP